MIALLLLVMTTSYLSAQVKYDNNKIKTGAERTAAYLSKLKAKE